MGVTEKCQMQRENERAQAKKIENKRQKEKENGTRNKKRESRQVCFASDETSVVVHLWVHVHRERSARVWCQVCGDGGCAHHDVHNPKGERRGSKVRKAQTIGRPSLRAKYDPQMKFTYRNGGQHLK